MPRRLLSAWIVLLVATLAVIGSGTFVVWKFVHHVTVPCSGRLVAVPSNELGTDARHERPADESNLELRWDEDRPTRFARGPGPYGGYTRYTGVRVVWTPPDATCACEDVAVPWPSEWAPSGARIYRDAETGLYVVRNHAREARVAFRRVGGHGRRLQWDRVVDPHNLSMLIFVLSLGALGLASAYAIRAIPYATRMHAWQVGTLRHDGLVESEHGASLGIMELRARVPSGPVIIDPQALVGDAYRGLPILTRRNVGAGSHQKWTEGTLRRLRDARSLAIIAAVTTTFALVARTLGA